MSLQFVKASTSDALTLNRISKRAFDSDVQVGAPSAGGPPGYMSVSYHTKMARTNAFYTKLGYVEVSRDNEFIYYIKKCE